MDKFVITGGNPLHGEVIVSGAKNAAVAILAAAVLVEDTCVIENVPIIKDVKVILEILRQLGAEVQMQENGTVVMNCSNLNTFEATSDLVRKMRASYYLLGALLGRFGKAQVSLPGGCDFGGRPIDQHIKGFEAMGAMVKVEHGNVYATTVEGMKGNSVYMDKVSVGATINIMIAATKAQGMTIIENAAKEPHVVDLANFLNYMGANIKGAGTDVIKIKGVDKLHGGTYSIIPDQIEAGTFLVAAAACGGDVLVKNVIPKHLDAITAKLVEMNVEIEEMDDAIRVKRSGKITKANVKTLPYPGFPTDMQPQIVALLSVAEGTSMVTEDVWDNRFQYVSELKRMGAQISVNGKTAVIEGVGNLTGAPVRSTDLRAGAAMLIAGLMAKGTTELQNLEHIDRGYENFEQKLCGLGAQLVREKMEE
ncbi:MAG: UDP-N-acetylglucosamine 1-carboxyvinyltransferase [Ruminococcaceae bacterium]|nr:UDP-N-acetylglucosamine 1-carboxyvinyltransferase [Oscillospiraceae bacterium]